MVDRRPNACKVGCTKCGFKASIDLEDLLNGVRYREPVMFYSVSDFGSGSIGSQIAASPDRTRSKTAPFRCMDGMKSWACHLQFTEVVK